MNEYEQIEKLIDAICEKHDAACTFSVKSYSGKYGSYFSRDNDYTTHQIHATLSEVIERFEKILAIDDLATYNKEYAKMRLNEIRDEMEDLEYKAKRLREILNV